MALLLTLPTEDHELDLTGPGDVVASSATASMGATMGEMWPMNPPRRLHLLCGGAAVPTSACPIGCAAVVPEPGGLALTEAALITGGGVVLVGLLRGVTRSTVTGT